MNDDPSSSSSARLDSQRNTAFPTTDATLDAVAPIGLSPVPSNVSQSRSRAGSHLSQSRSRAGSYVNGRRRRRKNKKKRNPGLAKKLEFVTHLLRSLDTLVFAELSALYYMECSMFRFLLRAAGQYLYLTPKEETLPIIMPATRAHVFLVVVPNLICMLLHMFGSMPSGPDYHRGYLHGGLVIDFVGQMPSTSRFYYVMIDFMLLILQSVMMTIHNERERLRVTLKTFKPLHPALAAEIALARTVEDIDAEERGISREDSSNLLGMEDPNDIEMQPLTRESTQVEGNEQNDGADPNGREGTAEGSERNHLSDVLTSGNGIVGEYHVLNAIRTAGTHLEDAAAGTLRRIGYEATAVALEARRRQTAIRDQTSGTNG